MFRLDLDGAFFAESDAPTIAAALEQIRAIVAKDGISPERITPSRAVVPDHVSDLQFRLALNERGLRVSAEAYVAAASQDVRDWWDRSLSIRRDDPMLARAASAIGCSEDDLDRLFQRAQQV